MVNTVESQITEMQVGQKRGHGHRSLSSAPLPRRRRRPPHGLLHHYTFSSQPPRCESRQLPFCDKMLHPEGDNIFFIFRKLMKLKNIVMEQEELLDFNND